MELIGYIRVSRVGGREGDSFISPDVQRERIAAYAAAKGHTIIDSLIDLDESGGKLERPQFQEALERCEAGEAQGIIVAKLDRFARSLADAAATVERLDEAACTLVSVADDIDASGPSGRLMRSILFAFAEFERDRISESWDVARAKAISRGIHATSVAPIGYEKVDGRLVPDPAIAPIVRKAFEQRAAGASITDVARLLDTANCRTFTNSAVRYVLRNRTYLGEVRSGQYVNRDAHEPLVTLALFEAANARKPVAALRRDSTGDGMLLSGLLRCAGCRKCMSVGRNGHKTHPVEIYRCKVTSASGKCPAPASISARAVEAYVVGVVMGAEADKWNPDVDWSAAGVEDISFVLPESGDVDLDALEAAVTDAELELTAYLTTMKPSDRGFRDGYEAQVRRLNLAADELANGVKMAQVRGVFDWPSLTLEERRRILRSKLQAIFVRQGGQVPLAHRCRPVFQWEPTVELPKRGVSSPLVPFEW